MTNLDYCEMWYRLKEKLDARKKTLIARRDGMDIGSLDRVITNAEFTELDYVLAEMEELKMQNETEAQRNG